MKIEGHLRKVATFTLTHVVEEDYLEMAREGIEPPTRGFSVRCSTN